MKLPALNARQVIRILINTANLKLFLLCIILLLSYAVQSQDYYSIQVIGYVKNDTRKLKGSVITLYSGSKQPDTVIVTPDGKFILDLDFDKEYTIELAKEGFVSKKIDFSTKNVPEKDKKEAFGFEFEISLFEQMEEVSTSVLKKPVAKVVYNTKKRIFDYDDSYTEQQQLKFHNEIQKQVKNLKRDLKIEILKKDSLMREIGQIKAEAEKHAKQIVESATQQADSILITARVSSNITKMITLYDTIVKTITKEETNPHDSEEVMNDQDLEIETNAETNAVPKDANELPENNSQSCQTNLILASACGLLLLMVLFLLYKNSKLKTNLNSPA